jgi:hypothetical protein
VGDRIDLHGTDGAALVPERSSECGLCAMSPLAGPVLCAGWPEPRRSDSGSADRGYQ